MKLNYKLHNKLGQVNWKVVLGALMFVIILLVLIYFVLKLYPISKPIDETLLCGNKVIGYGECKIACGPDDIIKLESTMGCPAPGADDKKFCCINPDKPPKDHGGNNDYRFTVYNIGISSDELKSGCTIDSTPEKKEIYKCTKRDVKVTLFVMNTGEYDLNIYANPKYEEDLYAGTDANAQLVKSGQKAQLGATINFKDVGDYSVYGAAKCVSKTCTEQFGEEGIFRLNDIQYIVIKITQ